jgi:acyl-CoA thioester hydrolase
MSAFNFYHPVEVRYGDLDPQGHVNNAKYLTYLEQARIAYFTHLGLWKGRSFLDIGVILAEVRLIFHAPILLNQQIRVGVRVSKLGNKSFNMEHLIEDTKTGEHLASCSAVLVAYDYHNSHTIPIPDDWREILNDYEGLD